MKKQKWTCWVVALALFFGGVFLGCGTNDRPAQKKQDGLPMVVTDKIPEEPATAQDSTTVQSQEAAQESEADAAPTKVLRDAIYKK